MKYYMSDLICDVCVWSCNKNNVYNKIKSENQKKRKYEIKEILNRSPSKKMVKMKRLWKFPQRNQI